VDVTHVINRRRWARVHVFAHLIEVVGRWEFFREQVVLEGERVVWAVREEAKLVVKEFVQLASLQFAARFA